MATGQRQMAFVLACSLCGCGSPTGPDGGSRSSTMAGTAVVVDRGIFGVDVEGEFRDEGTLQATLNWTVAQPGRGRWGSRAPSLKLEFFRLCPGTDCPGYSSAGPSQAGPLTVTGTVHTASVYVARIGLGGHCGGCLVEYSLQISHPEGSVRSKPAATCAAYEVTFPDSNPLVDPQASPPQARMREGERVWIDVHPRCDFTPGHHVRGWTTTNAAAAMIEEEASGRAFLHALRSGRTRVAADIQHIDGSPARAEVLLDVVP